MLSVQSTVSELDFQRENSLEDLFAEVSGKLVDRKSGQNNKPAAKETPASEGKQQPGALSTKDDNVSIQVGCAVMVMTMVMVLVVMVWCW